ncbi:MAG: oligopeptide:H+ symporter [Yaniella sp.]|uniref:peptide MFS transporter n=1 Tax=Yaniella sp. TaxID=2773929 RepID=UPI0026499619|nr:oligopeptide:H+ symporter [Yaniella sp.]MDN5732543.1 oligopeptide:H+ symporter [Yaniella sp.]
MNSNSTSGMTESETTISPRKYSLRNHPAGLWTVSLTEMWERLSFYGLQVLLAYYIYYAVSDGGLSLPVETALAITGAYGGVVYLTQPLGAWIADRLVPPRQLVVAGGVLIISGHVTLAITSGLAGLVCALLLIAIGTGALHPTLNTLVGFLYEDRDNDRDSGFQIYYAIFSFGALLGPIITGFLHVRFGFHTAFAVAAVGMTIGLLVYFLRWKTLPDRSKTISNPLTRRGKAVAIIASVALLAICTILVATEILNLNNVSSSILAAILVVAAMCFVLMLFSSSTTKFEKRRVIAYMPIFLAAIVFWTMVLQLFTTFAFYADNRVDLSIGPLEIPASYISTFEVVALIAAGMLIAPVWQKMGERQPSTLLKLVLGLAIMSCAFLLFAVFPLWFDGPIPLLAVIFGMVVFGIAEATYAPINMSAAVQLAPKAFKALMMGLSGLALAAGSSLSGTVGSLFSPEHESQFFVLTAAAIIVTLLGLFLIRKPLTRLGLN